LPHSLSVSAGALALLTAYDWPGNIRQLENAVFRSVVLAQGDELTEADFPQIALQVPEFAGDVGDHDIPHRPTERSLLVAPPPADVRTNAAEIMSVMEAMATDEDRSSSAVFPGGSLIASTDNSGDVRKIADIEEELIRFALRFYRGQMSQVARKLGIGRSTLYRKLKDYGIDPDNPLRDAA
jgi:DNA-binding NtrC family response regulator